MRAKKAENLKAVLLTMSIPPSLKQYIYDDCGNIGFTIQRWIAEKVLGPIMEEHYITYAGPKDIRFKPEPLKQSYIRALRWILESRITRAWQCGKVFTFEVDWLLTGKKGVLCQVDLTKGPGFVHVIYDTEVSEPIGVKTDYFTEPGLSTVSERYKWAIVSAWLRHSRRA